MIIKKNKFANRFEWCPRPKTESGVEFFPDISYDKINEENNSIVDFVNNIVEKLNSLDKSKTIIKNINNYNTYETLEKIDKYLSKAKYFIKFVIYNYDANIHIEVIKNFFVIDCIHNKNNKNITITQNNDDIKLKNEISFGFINFNYYNNNNRFLLDYAIESLKKYNDTSNFNFIIINDNRLKEDDYISKENNFICYNINDYNKINFNMCSFYKDLSHAIKIEQLIKLCKTKYLFLCDCDIIFKTNIQPYINALKEYDVVGEMGYDKIYPFFLGLNLETLKKKKFLISDIGIILTGYPYNTCEKLKNNINLFKFKNIELKNIIYHYGSASFKYRLDANNNYNNETLGQEKYIANDMKNLSIDDFVKLI